ncbi:hypothetical protein BKA70DRAFT_1443503 [Coprinopsis sp. MPI-PUGE-AT-0042]|nr:hypothetical protein BKA70DRAFT_1443503 [Coprinopsis sp. MPI-PUGE-AT-0042]
MSFDGASIPDDIWLTVFDLLGPAELGSLSRTCTKFHQLTQRPLLREITWSRAPSAQRNVADWRQGGSLSQFTGYPINQNGALVATVDWEFYDAAFHRLISFTNLHSLELADTILTPAVYPVLASIPSLRELNITRCTFIWSPLYPAILGSEQLFPLSGNGSSTTTTFDFSTRLNHLTHLTFKYNRMDQFTEQLNRYPEDAPYPPSEIGKPCILHPLYLLSIPTLTDVTLSWSANLMQVLDTLKQNYDFSQANQPGNHPPPGVVPQQVMFAHGIPPNALANALHSANPFGLNQGYDGFTRQPFRATHQLACAWSCATLRSVLRVGKHSLTEQHIGSIQFRLPGVYRYEGPLVIAGLLAAGSEALNTVNAIEELRMTEALDMSSVLFNLEKLPNTLKKLDIRVFKWDQEILYAVRALFKGLVELVIRYGRGGLSEIASSVTSKRFPFNPSSPFGMHSFTSNLGGGMGRVTLRGGPQPSINNHQPGGGGGVVWEEGERGSKITSNISQHHHQPQSSYGPGKYEQQRCCHPERHDVDDAEVDTDEEDEEGDEDFDDDVAAQFALMDQLEPSGRMSEEEQDAHWAALEAAHCRSFSSSAPPSWWRRGWGTGSATSESPYCRRVGLLHNSTNTTITPSHIWFNPGKREALGEGSEGRGGHSATLSSFATLGSWEVSPTAPGPPSSTVGTIIDTSALQQTATTSPTGSRHRYGWTSQPRAAGPATRMPTVTATPAPTSTSASAMRLNSSRSRTGASMTASPTSRSSVVAPSSTPHVNDHPERNPHRQQHRARRAVPLSPRV